MTKEIKSRLEQIWAGKVPEGYKQSPSGVIPRDWHNAKMSDVTEEIKETAGNKEYETLSISAGVGFVNQAKKFGREMSGAQYSKYTVLRHGDFSYNKGNSNLYPQGCIYRLNDREEAAVPNVFESFRFDLLNGDYYEQLFVSGYLNKQLYSKINHGVRDDGLLNLTGKDFYSCHLPVPPLPEQQKIAEILMQCDKVITLKKERIEEEKKRKKWLMDKLICNSKQSKGWTHAILGDYLLGLNAGTSVRSYSDDDGGQGENVSNSFFVLKTSAVSNGTFDENEKKPVITEDYSRVSCPLRKNTLVISRMNTPALVGACAYCNIESNTIFLPDRLWQAQSKNGESLLWLNYLLNTDYYQAKICLLASGTSNSMKNIAKEDMLRLNISVPNQEERTRIERVLAHYDKLICLYEQELFGWKRKKKALMQLLLTGIVRVIA